MAKNFKKEKKEFEEKIVDIRRVAKVVKGGRRFSFSALVVVGNGSGRVGFGLGKAAEVPEAIRKATDRAQRNLITVPLVEGRTIPHAVLGIGRNGGHCGRCRAGCYGVGGRPRCSDQSHWDKQCSECCPCHI